MSRLRMRARCEHRICPVGGHLIVPLSLCSVDRLPLNESGTPEVQLISLRGRYNIDESAGKMFENDNDAYRRRRNGLKSEWGLTLPRAFWIMISLLEIRDIL